MIDTIREIIELYDAECMSEDDALEAISQVLGGK